MKIVLQQPYLCYECDGNTYFTFDSGNDSKQDVINNIFNIIKSKVRLLVKYNEYEELNKNDNKQRWADVFKELDIIDKSIQENLLKQNCNCLTLTYDMNINLYGCELNLGFFVPFIRINNIDFIRNGDVEAFDKLTIKDLNLEDYILTLDEWYEKNNLKNMKD